jgi:hypothetical protein
MSAPEDDDLRRAFAELRRADAESAPAYDRVRGRPQGVRVEVPTGTLLVAASLVAAVIAGLAVRRPAPPPPAFVSLEHWTAPTDFLLETPGREILHGEPGIGTEERTLTP